MAIQEEGEKILIIRIGIICIVRIYLFRANAGLESGYVICANIAFVETGIPPPPSPSLPHPVISRVRLLVNTHTTHYLAMYEARLLHSNYEKKEQSAKWVRLACQCIEEYKRGSYIKTS